MKQLHLHLHQSYQYSFNFNDFERLYIFYTLYFKSEINRI